MKIAINARFASRAQPTGMQKASASLVSALIAAPRNIELVLIGDSTSAQMQAWGTDERIELADVPAYRGNRVRAQLWEQFKLPAKAKRAGATVLLNPMQTVPLVAPGIHNVVTVHDLNFIHHPEWFGRAFRAWNRTVTATAIRHADHVVAISDYVLQDVRAMLGVSVRKSSRVYNAGPSDCIETFNARPKSPPSVLCVNPFQPHKNLARVLAAFQVLRQEFPALELRLAGRPQENFARASGLHDLEKMPGVVNLGYISDAQLAAEYSQCSAFCFPSLAEGFGLPVLEAAAAGAIVVTSNSTSLPEVSGDSAILVNPLSVLSIASGLRKALEISQVERTDYIRRGLKNLSRFSPALVAKEYISILESMGATAETRVEPSASSLGNAVAESSH